MRIAICPGSFDPITLGHLNIIRRCSIIFDRVVVCIMVNSTKTTPMFSLDERADMVRRAVSKYPNVTGLRAASDFEYECQMDLINKNINPELETMFLTASGKYTFLSSSVVREMARYGADLTGLVPDEIRDDIERKAKQWRRNNG